MVIGLTCLLGAALLMGLCLYAERYINRRVQRFLADQDSRERELHQEMARATNNVDKALTILNSEKTTFRLHDN
ncbi:DNA-directed RNA polymerase specialized sigma subunit [Spirosoma lacussanchae]|uniref:hypothetical protein n=1 Tax=Spirosoma lacussanchae TaxID=1884249 RepID=UPI001107E87A|nr:hypothetical protein [Spirosoma lacussanchae]